MGKHSVSSAQPDEHSRGQAGHPLMGLIVDQQNIFAALPKWMEWLWRNYRSFMLFGVPTVLDQPIH